MHVHLTDFLTCPRCGPDYGLIFLADQVDDRRILDGWLGCSNCRERYLVKGGHGQLVHGPPMSEAQAGSEPEAVRLAALLGVSEGPATLLLVGSGAGNAARIAELVPEVEVTAAASGLEEQAELIGVSRVAVGRSLPFRNRSMQGVALTDEAAAELLAEAVRVAAARARVVVQSGNDDVVKQMEQSGLRIVARDATTIVAERGLF